MQKHHACGAKRPTGSKTHAKQSRPGASQSKQNASKKHAKLMIFSCVFGDFVNFADLESGLQGRSTTTKKQAGTVIFEIVLNNCVTFTGLSFVCKEGVQ